VSVSVCVCVCVFHGSWVDAADQTKKMQREPRRGGSGVGVI